MLKALRAPLIAFALYAVSLILLINGFKNKAIDSFIFRTSTIATYGKNSQEIINTRGSFRENTLNHVFFKIKNPNNKKIFIIGSSFANSFPLLNFKYKNEVYDVYTFAIGGNSIIIPIKLMGLVMPLKPDLIIFGVTPLFMMPQLEMYGVPFIDGLATLH